MKAGGLAALLTLVLAAGRPARLAAQSDPRLVAAIQLAQAGRQDSARDFSPRCPRPIQCIPRSFTRRACWA